MAFVIDASVVACWAFSDEDHPTAADALERLTAEEGHVPALWRFELCNVLIVSERRGRISESDTTQFLRSVSRLPIQIDTGADQAELLRVARAHGLSAYDAAYLELAMRQGLPMATLDSRLANAARSAGVALV